MARLLHRTGQAGKAIEVLRAHIANHPAKVTVLVHAPEGLVCLPTFHGYRMTVKYYNYTLTQESDTGAALHTCPFSDACASLGPPHSTDRPT